jgi:hypothetical protein
MVIVDANCSSDALGTPPKEDFSPIFDALDQGKAKLVWGGKKLVAEYKLNGVAWRALLQLDRAGRAHMANHAEVDAEQKTIEKNFNLVSDDPHILALARVSGARLLCSRDQALHQDFGNPRIISQPRGSVYQNASHKALIKKCC